MSPEYPSAVGAFIAAARTHIYLYFTGLGHALVPRGFQVVSEQLRPGRHAQTCPGIFGITEGSTDTQTPVRSTHPPILYSHNPMRAVLKLGFEEPSKIPAGYLAPDCPFPDASGQLEEWVLLSLLHRR